MLESPVMRLRLPGAPDSHRDLGISGSHCGRACTEGARVGTGRVGGPCQPPQEHPLACSQAPAHLEQVSLALAVDACEGCVNRALDAPDVADELGVAGPHACLIQLIEVLPWGERGGGSGRRDHSHQRGVTVRQHVPCARERSPRYLGKHKENRSSGR